jgi:putative membrane protein
MMWWYGGSGWGGWLAMALVMAVLWGVVILGGLAAWRALRRDDDAEQWQRQPDPERLLDERFARGEIDVEEYTRRRDLLRSGR